MKHAKIIDNIVIQIQPIKYDDKDKAILVVGFVEVADSVICGMIDNGNGTFSVVPKPQSKIDAERVIEIDAKLREIDILSIRSMRAKSRGVNNASDDTKLDDLDTQADMLRTERATLSV